jgi:hypothetical protein
MQAGLSEAVVEPEGLDGKSSAASAAAKSLDGATVALATEAAVVSVAEALTTGSRAAWMGAAKRSVGHGILLSEAWSGLGPTARTGANADGFRGFLEIPATARGARFPQVLRNRAA